MILPLNFLLEQRNAGTKGEKSQTRPTSAKDLTIELPEGHESLYNRLD